MEKKSDKHAQAQNEWSERLKGNTTDGNLNIDNQSRAWLFFSAVTARPKLIIALGFLLIIGFASFIPTIQKDTRSDAFIPEDHPALVFRNTTKEIFGLDDPMVIAITIRVKTVCLIRTL